MSRTDEDLKKDLFIPIEIKYRELNSQLFLAGFAISKGFRVYIGTHPAIERLLEARQGHGGIYFDKGGLNSTWERVNTQCEKIILLDQELSPITEDLPNVESILYQRFSDGNKSLLDVFCSVGPVTTLAANSVLHEKTHIVETGWPRIDLWKNAGALETEVLKLRHRYGRFLLFSSDFGVTSEKQLMSQVNFRQIKENRLHENHYFDPKIIEGLYSDFKSCVSLIRELDRIDSFPRVVVRPHPSDDFKGWKKELAGLRKTEVIHEGEITSWLMASEGLIHRGCTTVIQAVLSRKLSYFISSCATTEVNSIAQSLSTYSINDAQEFINLPTEEINWSAKEEILSKTVYMNHSKTSTEIIVELFDRRATQLTSSVGKLKYLRQGIKFKYLRRKIGWIKWELQWRLHRTPYEPPSQVVPGGLSKRDLQNAFANHPNRHIIKYKKIGKNLWVINAVCYLDK